MEENIDSFLLIEKQILEECNSHHGEAKSNNQFGSDYQNVYIKLKRSLKKIKTAKKDLINEKMLIQKERSLLVKEKAKIETDLIMCQDIESQKLAKLRKKYLILKERYKNEKESWEAEKRSLLKKIAILEKHSSEDSSDNVIELSNPNIIVYSANIA